METLSRLSDTIFHSIMDRRLNIVIYLAVIFLFCQAQVHTTSKSQCVKHRKYIDVKEIDEHFHVPSKHICATRIDYCAGLCHSVDQLLRGDGDLQTKCECCQPITLEEKKDTIVYCVNRKSKSKYLASKTVKVPVIKSCGCTPCLSLRTS
uniref:CTCK domain-containing protein n=1 Tax=Clytia hemisphaerica TaxID=252671 RepID=A0A7M5TY52_9CNID